MIQLLYSLICFDYLNFAIYYAEHKYQRYITSSLLLLSKKPAQKLQD